MEIAKFVAFKDLCSHPVNKFTTGLLACATALCIGCSNEPNGNQGVTDESLLTQAQTDSATEQPTASPTASTSLAPETENTVPVNIATDDASAARLLAQATFGTTLQDIERVNVLGIEGWINEQLNLTGSSHLTYAQANGNSSNAEARVNKWWLDAIEGEDQLRSRVAFALSQILVVSDVQQTLGNAQFGLAGYYDTLRQHAFGNYRDLLEDITLSPVMGVYLSMLQNAKADPQTNTRADENFAREVMQLFTIGLHELNIDGSQKLTSGRPVPSYTQSDVGEYARVFTGWGYANTDRWDAVPASQYADFLNPMVPYPQYHDSGEKKLLRGVISPAGLSAEEDLQIALDSLFNHPNVGPFISKQLILRLITSNPTPGYVARIATVFNDNGAGVRGDLKSVVRAILLDNEARNGHTSVPHFGKLREPLLRLTHLWRAFDAQYAPGKNLYSTNAPHLKNVTATLGQTVLGASSVFNFFHPDYAPLGALRNAALVAPEAEIYSENYVLASNTFISTYIHKFYYASEEQTGARFQTYINIAPQTDKAIDAYELLDELNLVMMSGQMPEDVRSILFDHISALPEDNAGRAQRVKDSISLIMTLPSYLVQK